MKKASTNGLNLQKCLFKILIVINFYRGKQQEKRMLDRKLTVWEVILMLFDLYVS